MFDGLESYGTHGHKLDNESDKRPSRLLAKGLYDELERRLLVQIQGTWLAF
jgi:hypothetical protein